MNLSRNKSIIALSVFAIGAILSISSLKQKDVKDIFQTKFHTETKEESVIEEKIQDKNSHAKGALYKVVSISDGDTISVNINGKDEKLRIIGINTPETVDPRREVQCFGKEASNKAKEILTGASVRLESDSSQNDRDKYGRLLRFVFLEDGTDFGKTMIKSGYAYKYTYGTPHKYENEYKSAEEFAKENKNGLWSQDSCGGNLSSKSDEVKIKMEKGEFICSKNTYNCSDFKNHDEAQKVFEMCGGLKNDIHKLDMDRNGRVCEDSR